LSASAKQSVSRNNRKNRAKENSKKSQKAKKPVQKSKNIQTVPISKKPSVVNVFKAQESSVTKEMKIWAMLGIMVLLLLCTWHLCPGVGEGICSFLHGMVGIFAYILPILISGSYIFYVANKGNQQATIKNIFFWLTCLVLDVLVQLLSFSSEGLESPLTYYELGQSGLSGGVVGGVLCGILQSMVGFLGTLLIVIILLIVCLVGFTQKSLLKPISKKAETVYSSTKEEIEKKKIRKHKTPLYAKVEPKEKVEEIEVPIEEPIVEELVVEEPIPEPQSVVRNIHRSEETEEIPVTSKRQEKQEFYAQKENKTLQEMDIFDEGELIKEEVQEEIINLIREPDVLRESDVLLEDIEVIETTFEHETVEHESVVEHEPVIEHEPVVEEVLPKKKESIWKETNPKDTSRQATSGAVFKSEAPKEVQKPKKVKPKKPYRFPPMDCLKLTKISERVEDDVLNSVADKLQKTLRDFGVGVTVTDISCGPTVTRYELYPDQGVKVSRIVSLTDDIKLSLAASDIRIEAPIPGKSAIGIEVPNEENQIVSFRELVSSSAFKSHPSKLAFAVGKDISGQIIVTDLAKTPHLLIAGATGSGKSVCINTLIMSILYKAKPDEVKFLMIDPKVVELSIYNGIPHLLIPVVTDPRKAANALNWAVVEMDERYKKMSEYGVRDVKGYNKKIEEENKHLPPEEQKEKLTQIVIIVDELADLMMVASSDVETAICRLAQKARAADMHLVLATQRPSVNVITGVIKANIPSRMAFAVSSSVDSRTIIDMSGAEKLLGKGDMLYAPSWIPKPLRVQGAFVSDEEVADVVAFLNHDNTVDEEAQNELEKSVIEATATIQMAADRDDYFEQAARFVIEKDKATIGMMQRAFKIGFNRAARIMDQLYEAGVVGPEEGTKPRKVLMSLEEFNDTWG
jgi:S-DNA-T family DNA segregation ATPase FtsK/SpoIIIE